MWSRSGAPAIASSIGMTTESRSSEGEAPGYETLTLTVGKSMLGSCCWTSVASENVPTSAISATSTKTSGGRLTKRRVIRCITPSVLGDRLPVRDPELAVRDHDLPGLQPADDRRRAVGTELLDVHFLRHDVDELVVRDHHGRVRVVEERRRRDPDAVHRRQLRRGRHRKTGLQ